MRKEPDRRSGLPLATLALIGLNLAVFLMLQAVPALQEELILDPQGFRRAPWTLLTVGAAHVSILPLAANMALLFLAGRALEEASSPGDVVTAYLICGTAGSFFSLLLLSLGRPVSLIPGASAAVFGLAAVYGALEPERTVFGRSIIHWVIFFLIYTAVAMLISPSPPTGGASHAGGILAGLALGHWLKGRRMR